MERTNPLPGKFLYVGWNVELRLAGPFVLPSKNRRSTLADARRLVGDLKGMDGIDGVRLLEVTFIAPLRGVPRIDIALLVNGSPSGLSAAEYAIGKSNMQSPALTLTAFNAVRFGDTDSEAGPILLNHFTSSGHSEDVVATWERISHWYGSKLGVNNSTLLSFDPPEPYAVMNYAAIPGPVVRFMLDQVLRPSFSRVVSRSLKAVDARALPIFAKRVI